MADKVFAAGLFLKERNERTPDFVLMQLSVKVDEFVAQLQEHRNDAGYVNIKMLRGKSGKPYFELDTWKPATQQNSEQQAKDYVKNNPPQQGFTEFNGQF